MKKYASAILLVLYFVFSSGVVINLHYCMDRFDSFKLGSQKSDVCGKCGMHTEDSDGCCKDELKFVKIQDDQQTPIAQFNFESIDAIVSTPDILLNEELQGSESTLLVNNHSPPLNDPPIHILNCVFRI